MPRSTRLGAFARREHDDRQRSPGGDQGDEQRQPPAEASPLLAEEHDRPAVRRPRIELGIDLVDVDRLGDVLEPHPAAVAVVEAAEATRQPRGRVADDHFAARSSPAEAGGDVQRRSAEAPVLELHRLAGVDADPDAKRDVELRRRLLELRLQVHGGADRLTRRREDDERLVPAHLDEVAVVRLDVLVDDLGESLRQRGGSLVAALLGVAGVPPDVGDQECANAAGAFSHGHGSSVCRRGHTCHKASRSI